MREPISLRSLLIGISILLAAPVSAATVVSVGDGDTLRLVEGGRRITVRLACIDAPEMAQAPYGVASRQRLRQLAPVGSVVTLRPQAIDRYGRTVAEISSRGASLNLAMVSSGQAFAYRTYLAACDQGAYLGSEAAAQRQRLGVWAVPGGIQRPWIWRHSPQVRHTRTASVPASSAPLTFNGPHYTCRQIGSYARAQELLRQGHSYLDVDGDGSACESLRRASSPSRIADPHS